MNIEPIAHIENPYKEKFGIPRQGGTTDIVSKIVFCDKYRDAAAVRGIEEFSHLWLIWEFSETEYNKFSPTVRPPRLGGNKHVGVFASRSPFRPNRLGLSVVKLEKVECDDGSPVIYVTGADLMSGTPIYDIKPYLPCFDCVSDAGGSYSDENADYRLKVIFSEELLSLIPKNLKSGLLEILSEDPRPSYHNDPDRIYGLSFDKFNIRFKVANGTLTVISVE